MSDAVSSILSQIRSYQSQLATPALPPLGKELAANPSAVDFGNPGIKPASFTETLQSAIEGVNSTQKNAGALATAFELGDPRADLARVMVAAQQSQVAFRATVEVRNRLVQAYQDVMNMPL
ncbi:flagellar hook-basal body complex protein FliE [Pseudoxanthomonas dokdonensis]|uniref:Flagellar hook-basal body complex protein FliE n=1 Tax=Pseudoxanthomonas dokdonensis TaxID=344882 RepID=A0A0R0CM11_9GAMM|nr:flagellar hook-basal body complex protein FliE [Pseudoxanthomonas dokdonensis]KRG71069.1 flagellar hook-basal body protein [Pseudoxanthomonas dokdonensis]